MLVKTGLVFILNQAVCSVYAKTNTTNAQNLHSQHISLKIGLPIECTNIIALKAYVAKTQKAVRYGLGQLRTPHQNDLAERYKHASVGFAEK